MYNMEEIIRILPKNLLLLRNNKNLTREDVSDKLKITTQHLKNIEFGYSMPSLLLLINMSQFYGVEFINLITMEDDILEHVETSKYYLSRTHSLDASKIYENTSKNLKFMRKNLYCLSLREMGDMSNISYQGLQYIELGKNNATLETLVKICNTMDFNIEKFIDTIDTKSFLIRDLNKLLWNCDMKGLTKVNKFITKLLLEMDK